LVKSFSWLFRHFSPIQQASAGRFRALQACGLYSLPVCATGQFPEEADMLLAFRVIDINKVH